MFNQKAIAACNNVAFSPLTIVAMHESAARLYQAANALARTSGQSAVAHLLNLSPQRVKNWETRGVSNEGAILVQRVIGCNVNWLLEGSGSMTPGPATYPPTMPQAALGVREDDALSWVGWPFKSLSPWHIAQLRPTQLSTIEATIWEYLAVRDPPLKRNRPENKRARA